ncbi:MAG: ATP-binding protein [Saprospiraceae bacterium]
MFKRLIALGFLLLGISLLIAQNNNTYSVVLRHITLEEGLSNRDIQAIHKDSRNFIWLGTRYGLNRYDGFNFEWFSKEKNGLAANQTQLILEDSEGWLWLFEMENWEKQIEVKSLSFINIHTFEIQSLAERFPQAAFLAEDIFSATSDPNGNIWLSLRDNRLVHYTGKSQFQIKPSQDERTFPCQLIQFTPQGDLLAASILTTRNTKSVFLLDTTNQITKTFFTTDSKSPIAITNDRKLLVEDLQTNKGFLEAYQLMKNQAPQRNFSLPNQSDWLSKAYWDQQRQWIWSKSSTYFKVIDTNGNSIIDAQEFGPQLAKSEIHRVFFDETNATVFVGTAQGLFLLKLNESKFKRLLYKDPKIYGYNETYSCRQIMSVGDELFVNTNKRRQKINLATSEVTTMPIQSTNDETSLYDFVLTNWYDRETQNLWFGDNALSKYDLNTEAEVALLHEGNLLKEKIWSIYQPKAGKLWLGLENAGFAIFDQQTEQYDFFNQFNQFSEFSNCTVYHFLPLDERQYLLATTAGLFVLDVKKGLTQHYSTQGEGQFQLPNNNIYHLHQDAVGTIWAGTGGGGLLEMDYSAMGLVLKNQFTVIDGLSNNTIYAVYEDKNGWLWMPSDYGIIRFNKESHFSKAYLPEDGVSFTEFNRISHHRADDGTLYFGSLNGVTAFHPRDFQGEITQYDKSIHISQFAYLNKETGKWADGELTIKKQAKIHLHPQQTAFRLQFTLDDYFNTNRNRFVYRIKGVVEDWTYLTKNILSIWQLPYGNHQLEVKVQGANGQFSSQIFQIPVTVTPPFYLRPWFFIAAFLCTMAGFFLFYQIKTRRLLQQKELLEATVAERTADLIKEKKITEQQNQQLQQLNTSKDQLFAIIGHDLRKPAIAFRGISKKVNYLLQRNDFQTLQQLGKNWEAAANSLNHLISNLLNWALQQRGVLPLELEAVALPVAISDSLQSITNLAADKNIELIVNVPENTKVLADFNSLVTIMRNVLDNAIKFTPENGQIKVEAKVDSEQVQISVQDSGIGMNTQQVADLFTLHKGKNRKGTAGESGTGLGLNLVRELIIVNEGEVFAESEPNAGTTIKIILPNAA